MKSSPFLVAELLSCNCTNLQLKLRDQPDFILADFCHSSSGTRFLKYQSNSLSCIALISIRMKKKTCVSRTLTRTLKKQKVLKKINSSRELTELLSKECIYGLALRSKIHKLQLPTSECWANFTFLGQTTDLLTIDKSTHTKCYNGVKKPQNSIQYFQVLWQSVLD